MLVNDQKEQWNKAYEKEKNINGTTFPSEYVIRMFKGKYPDCDLNDYSGGYEGKAILDVSCGGVGRDLVVFKQVGFDRICATEITPEIVKEVEVNSKKVGIDIDARVGNNRNLPFKDAEFDFLITWNACYYFDDVMDFSLHVAEYARVCKKSGVMVFSIPKKNCFIYKDCIEKGNGLVEITSDPFGDRNGVILKRFEDEQDIIKEFGEYFEDFHFGSIEDNCFGLSYSWHIGYCRRR